MHVDFIAGLPVSLISLRYGECLVTALQVSKRNDAWPQPCSFNPVISGGAERCKPTDFERPDARFLDTHPWRSPTADLCLKPTRLGRGGCATCLFQIRGFFQTPQQPRIA